MDPGGAARPRSPPQRGTRPLESFGGERAPRHAFVCAPKPSLVGESKRSAVGTWKARGQTRVSYKRVAANATDDTERTSFSGGVSLVARAGLAVDGEERSA